MCMTKLEYEARIERLGVKTLKKRIETYKILSGCEDVDYKIFEYCETCACAHSNSCKLKKREDYRTLARANSFNVRFINR